MNSLYCFIRKMIGRTVMSKAFKMLIYFEGFVTYNSIIYPSTKGILDTYDIIIDLSMHVECVVGIQKIQ